MYARTIVAHLVPGKADEATEIFRTKILPEIRKQPGYISTAVYLDREHSKAQTVSLWESAEAEAATSQNTEYLTRVVGMLRGCLVNRDFDRWEVTVYDHV